MSRLDDELKNALHREAPPSGFEARLLARLAAEPQPKARLAGWFRLPDLRLPLMTRWAFAAALCLVFVAGFHFEAERRERVQQERVVGEAAKDQLMLALRVTGTQLQIVHDKVRGLNEDSSLQR